MCTWVWRLVTFEGMEGVEFGGDCGERPLLLRCCKLNFFFLLVLRPPITIPKPVLMTGFCTDEVGTASAIVIGARPSTKWARVPSVQLISLHTSAQGTPSASRSIAWLPWKPCNVMEMGRPSRVTYSLNRLERSSYVDSRDQVPLSDSS